MTYSSTPTSTRLKIAVDTNLYLSVFVFRGRLMKLVFELVIDDKIDLYISPILKDELSEKLHYFGVSKQIDEEVMSFIKINGILVEPTIRIRECRDSEDNFLLELAETAKADYLITRDKDLLSLPNSEWKITKIITPEVLLSLLRTKKFL